MEKYNRLKLSVGNKSDFWHKKGLFSVSGFFLTILVIITTSFEYIWVGPLPLWLMISLVALLAALFSRQQRGSIAEALKFNGKTLFLPMLLFMLMALLIDVAKGSLADSFSKRYLLNFSLLISMLAVSSMSMLVRRTYILYLLALIASVQGLICIAQFMGSQEAWTLAEKIAALFGRIEQDDVGAVNFASVHRVKGTNLFIHKFTPMQGVLVTFLMVVGLLNFQYKNPLKISMFLMFSAITIGAVGMILTFSRSVILGSLIAIVLVLISARNIKMIFAMLLLAGSLLVAESIVNIEGGKEFSRITDTSMTRSTNASRLHHFNHSKEVFSEYPLIGEPYNPRDSHRVLVHSVPLRVIVEYGLLGFFPYAATLYLLMRKFKKASKSNNEETLEIKIFGKAALYSLMVAFIDNASHSSGFLIRDVVQGVLFALFTGIIWQKFGSATPDKA